MAKKLSELAPAWLLDKLGSHNKAELEQLCQQQDISTRGAKSKDELIYRLVTQPKLVMGRNGRLEPIEPGED